MSKDIKYKTIKIDERLFYDLETIFKTDGKTWNDVLVQLLELPSFDYYENLLAYKESCGGNEKVE